MRWAVLTLIVLVTYGCGGGNGVTSSSTVDALTANQRFMVGEMQRFEPMLDMGRFEATFKEPPVATYAGWALCQPGGRPPWYVMFNREYIESLSLDAKSSYMSALVAHEMCHHWVVKNHGSCYDEAGAEQCAANLIMKGKPE